MGLRSWWKLVLVMVFLAGCGSSGQKNDSGKQPPVPAPSNGQSSNLLPSSSDQEELERHEFTAANNLVALNGAQNRYKEAHGFYAASASVLNADEMNLPTDLVRAFEQWQGNEDAKIPTPKYGYVYRMLTGGDSAALAGYWQIPGNPNAGMTSFGAIARATDPGVTGRYQFLVTPEGNVYRALEPASDSPGYKSFVLNWVPDIHAGTFTWQMVTTHIR